MHVPDPREAAVARRYFKPFIPRFAGCRSVVDVASGQGHFLRLMREAGVPCRGLEIDAGLCARCLDEGLDVLEGSFFDLLAAAEESAFDGAFVSHIIEHFTPAQVEELFRLLARASAPGALLIVITPNIANIRRAVGDFWRDPTHVRPYPISAIQKLLRRAGGWEFVEGAEYTDRKPSLRRRILYGVRNALIGRYWVGDDLYVVARRGA